MGAQTSTSACANATTPAPTTSISICPAGWRLPTGGSSGEYVALNTSVNGGSTLNDAGLRSTWLMQRAGMWYDDFSSAGDSGTYWSSTQVTPDAADQMYYSSGSGFGVTYFFKNSGNAVRCVAV